MQIVKDQVVLLEPLLRGLARLFPAMARDHNAKALLLESPEEAL